MCRTRAFLIPIVALVGVASVDAQVVPVEVSYGWQTEIEVVASIAPQSLLAKGIDDSIAKPAIALKWDELTFVVPIWVCGREYVLCDAEPGDRPQKYWLLKQQDKDSVVDISGVPKESLSFPFQSYVPSGWILVVLVFVVATIICGPSPKTRFNRLMRDGRYRKAVELMVSAEASDAPEDGEGALEKSEAEGKRLFDNSVEFLVSEGISRAKATKNLEFLVGFLARQATEPSQG